MKKTLKILTIEDLKEILAKNYRFKMESVELDFQFDADDYPRLLMVQGESNRMKKDESELTPATVKTYKQRSKAEKKEAYSKMQNKISLLRCNISVESILNPRIEQLEREFAEEYGDINELIN